MSEHSAADVEPIQSRAFWLQIALLTPLVAARLLVGEFPGAAIVEFVVIGALVAILFASAWNFAKRRWSR